MSGPVASIREHRSRLRLILTRQCAATVAEDPARRDRRDAEAGYDATRDRSDELTDEQLLLQHYRGNRQAFGVLYRRYCDRARTLALNVTRDENDANDVVQEAFIRVLRYWSRFHGHAAFYTWLYRIIYNLSIDQVRRVCRQRNALDQVEPLVQLTPDFRLTSPAAANPFDACVSRELRDAVAAAIESLPRYQRNAIVMREVYGMSYSEIAVAMACSKGTVMSRLFHARNRLQVLLQPSHDPARPAQSRATNPRFVSSRVRGYGQR